MVRNVFGVWSLLLFLISCQNNSTSDLASVGMIQKPWPSSTIAYRFDQALTDRHKSLIEDGLKLWSDATMLRFVHSDVTTPAIIFRLTENKDIGGQSYIGYQGNKLQSIWLNPNSFTAGTVAHEVGHAIGLKHEHTRTDRDGYVQIHFENIKSDYVDNFEIDGLATDLGSYDFDSIMHYTDRAFAIDPSLPTISRIDNGEILGQRELISKGDRIGAASMFRSVPFGVNGENPEEADRIAYDVCEFGNFTGGFFDGHEAKSDHTGHVYGLACFEPEKADTYEAKEEDIAYWTDTGDYVESFMIAKTLCGAHGNYEYGFFSRRLSPNYRGLVCVWDIEDNLFLPSATVNDGTDYPFWARAGRKAHDLCVANGYSTGRLNGYREYAEGWYGEAGYIVSCFSQDVAHRYAARAEK